MIESRIKNELNLKRWRRFKARKMAVLSSWLLIIATFISFTSTFWANNKPLYMSYKGNSYFPVFVDYHPSDFGIEDMLIVNYRKFELSENDSVIWPLIKWDPFESNKEIDTYPGPPTKENLLGTDDRGRDVLTRLIYGLKYSISYAVLVWFITFVLGTIVGGVMGFYGGKFDFFGQRIVEILSSVPQFFLLLIVIAIFEPGLLWLVIISSMFGWIPISYYIRGEFLKNRKKEYVESARASGASVPRQIFAHILPNSLAPIITFTPFTIAGGVMALASLDYLGFGLVPPTPSWGELLNQAQKYFTIAWWLAVYPSLALFVTLTSLTLIGEGVRDAMDPNMN